MPGSTEPAEGPLSAANWDLAGEGALKVGCAKSGALSGCCCLISRWVCPRLGPRLGVAGVAGVDNPAAPASVEQSQEGPGEPTWYDVNGLCGELMLTFGTAPFNCCKSLCISVSKPCLRQADLCNTAIRNCLSQTYNSANFNKIVASPWCFELSPRASCISCRSA